MNPPTSSAVSTPESAQPSADPRCRHTHIALPPCRRLSLYGFPRHSLHRIYHLPHRATVACTKVDSMEPVRRLCFRGRIDSSDMPPCQVADVDEIPHHSAICSIPVGAKNTQFACHALYDADHKGHEVARCSTYLRARALFSSEACSAALPANSLIHSYSNAISQTQTSFIQTTLTSLKLPRTNTLFILAKCSTPISLA
jgi:hypothetical protein